MKTLRGKYLVRKSKLVRDGTPVLILTGVFYPTNFDIDSVKDNDEMWVSDLEVRDGGIRFTEPYGRDGGSPEDFLEGEMMSSKCWKTKSKLI